MEPDPICAVCDLPVESLAIEWELPETLRLVHWDCLDSLEDELQRAVDLDLEQAPMDTAESVQADAEVAPSMPPPWTGQTVQERIRNEVERYSDDFRRMA